MDTRIRVCPFVKEVRILLRVRRKDLILFLLLVWSGCGPDVVVVGDRVNVFVTGAREGSRMHRRRERRWADSVDLVKIRTLGCERSVFL